MAESVKVAVRVRPFNKRELEMVSGNELCIEMNGNQTIIHNIHPRPADKDSYTFTFDYSYWSHDEFEDVDGYYKATGHKYADQDRVFNELGRSVLDNAFDGYNTCLFAYGQTGSGKSYSMIGYEKNQGIVPMVCDEIFKRIAREKNDSIRYEVSVSMLEIYNENIQDLLVHPKLRKDIKSLKVNDDPQKGPYVDNLTSHPVTSYEEINEWLETGSRNRTVGETKMNQTSSRAHTVFRIQFKQIEKIGDDEAFKTSDINLIDLAGSERAGSTGATGTRLKEGCNINQSLSTLGKVISALADKALGKLPKSAVIPYRESKLTRILQSALGGNSRTTMIAALSPSYANYEETLSTLRYADRVKAIKNEARQNTDPASEELRRLQEENAKLRALIDGKGGVSMTESPDVSEMKAEYERRLRDMENMQLSFEERLKRSREQAQANRDELGDDDSKSMPELRNVSDDPQLTGRVKYPLKEGTSVLGRAPPAGQKEGGPDIPIVASGMLAEHARIETVKTSEDGEEDEYESRIEALGKVLVNGELMTPGEQRLLFHKDVISFGSMKFLLFWDPQNIDKVYPDWEEVTALFSADAQGLLGNESGGGQLDEAAIKEEVARKMQANQAVLDQQKQQVEAQRLEFERQMHEREKALATKDREEALRIREELRKEKEKQKRELEAQQRALEQKQKELAERESEEKRQLEEEMRAKRLLESTIAKALLLVDEANNMADDLQQPVIFSLKLVHRPAASKQEQEMGTFRRTELQVSVDRFEEDVVHVWPLDLFEERLYLIKDLWNDWLAADDPSLFPMPTPNTPEDPFGSDPDSLTAVGQAQLYLDSIRYLMSIEQETIPVLDYKGARVGEIAVQLLLQLDDIPAHLPEDVRFEQSQKELDMMDAIEDLVGRPVRLTLIIDRAFGIPAKTGRRVQVRAKWIDGYSDIFCESVDDLTTGIEGDVVSPVFSYARDFVIPVTEETAKFFQKDLFFEVLGMAPLAGDLNSTANLKSVLGTNGVSTRSNGRSRKDNSELESKLAEKEVETNKLQKDLQQKEALLAALEAKASALGKSLYKPDGSLNLEALL